MMHPRIHPTKRAYVMNNRLSVLLPFLFLAFISSVSELSGQEIHACVVIPGTNKTNSYQEEPTYSNLPGVVQKAVALGGPENGGYNSNFWPNGGTLRVRFMGGSPYVRQQVKRYAQEWTRHANLNFTFVTSGASDIRVSFVQNGSSWSVLGRQAKNAPESRATMNFGWLTDATPDYEFRRTILHEFGHALGLLHEHQNPTGGIPWDEEAVYAFYLRTQGWGRRTTYTNVIARRQRNETQYSAYDPASIMHYPVDPRLTRGNYEVGMNTAISATDARFIAQLYPGRSGASTTASTSPGRPTPVPSDRPVVTPPRERPAPPVRPAVVKTFEVDISNSLGEGQRAEVVELYLDNRKHLFELRAGQRSQQAIRLRLKPGVYPYSIRTASLYAGTKRVWNGQRYVQKRQNHKVYGGGEGRLRVSADGRLAFYGEYDKESGRMKVYLGER